MIFSAILQFRRKSWNFKHLSMFWLKSNQGKEKKDKHCQKFYEMFCSFSEFDAFLWFSPEY